MVREFHGFRSFLYILPYYRVNPGLPAADVARIITDLTWIPQTPLSLATEVLPATGKENIAGSGSMLGNIKTLTGSDQ